MRKVVTRSISFQPDSLKYLDGLCKEVKMNRSEMIEILIRVDMKMQVASNFCRQVVKELEVKPLAQGT